MTSSKNLNFYPPPLRHRPPSRLNPPPPPSEQKMTSSWPDDVMLFKIDINVITEWKGVKKADFLITLDMNGPLFVLVHLLHVYENL